MLHGVIKSNAFQFRIFSYLSQSTKTSGYLFLLSQRELGAQLLLPPQAARRFDLPLCL